MTKKEILITPSATSQQAISDNPLQAIKERNQGAITKINDVLAITLGHKFGRLMHAGLTVFTEYLLYALALFVLLSIFMIEKVSPFYLLDQMQQIEVVQDALNPHIISSFVFVIKSMIGLISLLILLLALTLRKGRLRKNKLQTAIVELRTVTNELALNNEQLDTLDKASDNIFDSANFLANEASIK